MKCLRGGGLRQHLRKLSHDSSSEELVSIVGELFVSGLRPSSVVKPAPTLRSFNFCVPPRWASLVPGRIKAALSLQPSRPSQLLEAFIHPSFVRFGEAHIGMERYEALGNSLLTLIAQVWIASAFESNPSAFMQHSILVNELCSDRVLSCVCGDFWKLSDVILTGAGVSALKVLGLPRKTAATPSMCANCVRAVIAVVYLTQGPKAAVGFVSEHVIQPAILFSKWNG